jgi:hypothetical protein
MDFILQENNKLGCRLLQSFLRSTKRAHSSQILPKKSSLTLFVTFHFIPSNNPIHTSTVYSYITPFPPTILPLIPIIFLRLPLPPYPTSTKPTRLLNSTRPNRTLLPRLRKAIPKILLTLIQRRRSIRSRTTTCIPLYKTIESICRRFSTCLSPLCDLRSSDARLGCKVGFSYL